MCPANSIPYKNASATCVLRLTIKGIQSLGTRKFLYQKSDVHCRNFYKNNWYAQKRIIRLKISKQTLYVAGSGILLFCAGDGKGRL